MIMESATPAASTRERLLAEGMRLFAERGFTATTVGDIEAAAGLQPRRGAMYRHFASKEALLDAAVRQHIEEVRAGRAALTVPPLDDLHAEILALGRHILALLDAQRDVTHVLEHDGQRVDDLRTLFRTQVSDIGYQATAEVIRRWTDSPPGTGPETDIDALAVLVLGSLINLRRSEWTLGAPPLGVDEERVLAAWTDQVVRLIGELSPLR